MNIRENKYLYENKIHKQSIIFSKIRFQTFDQASKKLRENDRKKKI